MVASTDGTPAVVRDEAFRAIADRRRRALLRVLDRRVRATPAELARYVVAEETGTHRRDVGRRAAEGARRTLEHVHLPRLRDVGFVSREEGLVVPTGHPALQDDGFRELIATEDRRWDEVLTCLADERRRVTLAALARNDGPMDREALAADVARAVDAGTQDGGHEVLVELHHLHLPKLQAAGLVTYDAEDGWADYEGHRAIDEQWFVPGGDDTPPTITSTAD